MAKKVSSFTIADVARYVDLVKEFGVTEGQRMQKQIMKTKKHNLKIYDGEYLAMEVRHCHICDKLLELDHFYRSKSQPSGFESGCKDCRKARKIEKTQFKETHR